MKLTYGDRVEVVLECGSKLKGQRGFVVVAFDESDVRVCMDNDNEQGDDGSGLRYFRTYEVRKLSILELMAEAAR